MIQVIRCSFRRCWWSSSMWTLVECFEKNFGCDYVNVVEDL
jgi:hypothetical protein